MAVRQYEVIDHTQGKSKSMQFNMNAALKKLSVTCKKETEFTANQAGSSVEEFKGEPFQSE